MEHFDMEPTRSNKLLAMAGHTETAVNRAIEALTTAITTSPSQVKQEDEVIDRFEVEVDRPGHSHPRQSLRSQDLRFVTVAIEISRTSKRGGDEATKIAKRARDLSKNRRLKSIWSYQMAGIALSQLKGAWIHL